MKKPKPEKEKRLSLKTINCLQLADWVVQPLGGKVPNKWNEALRRRYAHPKQLEKLRLCGTLNAVSHVGHVRTAARLQVVPTIALTATGGRPKANTMPRYDRSLVKMGAQHGLVIHRYEKGAFIHGHPLKNNLPD